LLRSAPQACQRCLRRSRGGGPDNVTIDQLIGIEEMLENEFVAATAKLPADEDDIYSVVADPILRNALRPPEERG
jgi:hypothetical protein